MRVINRVRLRDFWLEHPRTEDSLRAWYQLMSSVDWETSERLTATFPAADAHADLVAFDIHGSSYFVIVSVDYSRSTIWVRDVLVHSDFHTDQWKALAASEKEGRRSYDDLVRQLPLRPIHDGEQLGQAITEIDSLVARAHRSVDEQDYLDVLSLLVAEYEQRCAQIPPVSGAAIVRLLISEHRMSQTEIIPLLGGKQKSTALLQGRTPLDLRQATRAARYFKLPVETFMDPDDLEVEIPNAPRRR